MVGDLTYPQIKAMLKHIGSDVGRKTAPMMNVANL